MSSSQRPQSRPRNRRHGRAERDPMEGLLAGSLDCLDRQSLRFSGRPGAPIYTLPAFDAGSAPPADIKEVQYIGSYNWSISRRMPVIIVPGSPRIWKDRPLPYTLQTDAELYHGKPMLANETSYRIPSEPMLPLFLSVDSVCDQTGAAPPNWPTIDIITERNNLRKLLRWATGTSQNVNFRIDLELVGRKTVLLRQWDERTHRRAEQTYGFSFEDYAAEAPLNGVANPSHYRIVAYSLGGLQVIVRYESDACLSSEKDVPNTSSTIVSLTEGFSDGPHPTPSASNRSHTTGNTQSQAETLAVQRGGVVVPQQQTAELKTRSQASGKTKMEWAKVVPQLVLSQTPNLLVGVYSLGGTVERVHKYGLEELAKREADFQPALRRLRSVLSTIQERIVAEGLRARVSLVCRSGVLGMYVQKNEPNRLPADIAKRFDP